MRRYKLYLEGLQWIDANGKIIDYKYTTSRDSKRAVWEYGRNATITDMHDNVVSKAVQSEDGKIYNVNF